MAEAQTVLAESPAPACGCWAVRKGERPLRPVGLGLRLKSGEAFVLPLPCKPPSSTGVDGAFGEDCLSVRHPLMTGASSAAAVHAEQRRDTAPAAVCRGGLFFGDFLLAGQKKVTSRRAAPGDFVGTHRSRQSEGEVRSTGSEPQHSASTTRCRYRLNEESGITMDLFWLFVGIAAAIWLVVDIVRLQDMRGSLPPEEQDRLLVGKPMPPEQRERWRVFLYWPASSRRFLLVVVLVVAICASAGLLRLQG